MRCETAASVTTSLSITKPGFTPVPISATPDSFAALSSLAASSGCVRNGYDNSSQVETIDDSASRHISNWSITFASDDDVEWVTTSAFCSSTSLASAETVTPQGASCAPTTSPRSRPTFAGSVSMAPMISIACFSRINRAIDAPIGPTPYWMARIFFFTSFSVSLRGRPLCGRQNLYRFAVARTFTALRSPEPLPLCGRQNLYRFAVARTFTALRSPEPLPLCGRQNLYRFAVARTLIPCGRQNNDTHRVFLSLEKPLR